MLKEVAWILAAAAALWLARSLTGFELLGRRGAADYLMLLVLPLAAGAGLTVYCRSRLRWAYGILAVTVYCFGRMLYMGATGYADGREDPTMVVMGVTSLNWAVMSLFAGLGGGAGGFYYKVRELNDRFGD